MFIKLGSSSFTKFIMLTSGNQPERYMVYSACHDSKIQVA